MITLAHHPIVQDILDSWKCGILTRMQNAAGSQPPATSSQPEDPTAEDLRILIKSLEDKLDELGSIVDLLLILQPLLSSHDIISLNPDRNDPESLTRKHGTPTKTPEPIP